MAAATRDRAALTGAVKAGWSIGGGGQALRAFTRVWHGHQHAPWLVLLPAVAGATGNLPLLSDEPDPAELARRLQRFADTVGQPWKVSNGATGLDLLTTLRFRDRERMLAPSEPVPPALLPGVERDISWSRHPTEEEKTAALRARLRPRRVLPRRRQPRARASVRRPTTPTAPSSPPTTRRPGTGASRSRRPPTGATRTRSAPPQPSPSARGG